MLAIRHFLPAILVFLVINYLLFFYEPSTDSAHIPYADKVIHLTMFITLSFLLFYGFYKSTRYGIRNNLIIIVMAITVLYAGLTEIVQHYYVEGRTGDRYDFIADGVGIVLGFYLHKPIKNEDQ